MKVGIPKEVKILEFRVGMVPAGVRELIHDGHEVFVETSAGAGIGMLDADYEAAGATILDTAKAVYDTADLIVKVKEPQAEECSMLRADQILFTYLHLAADPAQTEALVKSGTTAIAYETVTADDGSLPLLTPMSEVAGASVDSVRRVCVAESEWRPWCFTGWRTRCCARQSGCHRRGRRWHSRSRNGCRAWG